MSKRIDNYVNSMIEQSHGMLSYRFLLTYNNDTRVFHEKRLRISFKVTVERLLRFSEMNFMYTDLSDVEFYDIIKLMEKIRERMDVLITEGRHPSIIDVSLFKIFSRSGDEHAEFAYKSYCDDKVKKWNDVPSHLKDTKSISYYTKKYGEEMAGEEQKRAFALSKINRTTCIEHYLNKGMTLVAAKEALRERQTTFSLEKCVLRFGKEEGIRIWEERQRKWQNTMNSKTHEEISLINSKKACNHDVRFVEDRIAIFYVIELGSSGTYKIGITTKDSVDRRYSRRELEKHSVICLFKTRADHVEKVERVFKMSHFDNLIADEDVIYEKFGRTETYKNLSADYICETVNSLFVFFDECDHFVV